MAPPEILVEEVVNVFYESTPLILSQYAYGLSGFGGRLNGSSIRGANSQSPMGADRFRPHWIGPRVEQWEMWVSSNDPATDLPGGRAQAMANLDTLKATFLGAPGVSLSIERMVRLPGVMDLTSRTCEAVVKDFRVASTAGGSLHRVTIDVEIPIGAWLGANVSNSISDSGSLYVTGSGPTVPQLSFAGDCEMSNPSTGTGFVYVGPPADYWPAEWRTDPPEAIAGLTPTSLLPFTLRPGSNDIGLGGSTVDYSYDEVWI